MGALLAGYFADRANGSVCKKTKLLTFYRSEDNDEKGLLIFMAPLNRQTGEVMKRDTRHFFTDQNLNALNIKPGDKVEIELVLDGESRVKRRKSQFFGLLNVVAIKQAYSSDVVSFDKFRQTRRPG